MKKPFGGEKSEQYNAVYNAIIECGKDHTLMKGEEIIEEQYECYRWLEEVPKTSLTAELVNKLNELGFEIIKSK